MDMKGEKQIRDTIDRILPPDRTAMEQASFRWDSIAKPLHSLGRFEEMITQIAGIQRTDRVDIRRKALVIMCADNGVVEEGVTQTGQEVTAIVAGNFLAENTSVSIMSACAGADVFPMDVGMVSDVPGMDTRKTAYGTRNLAKEPAMTRKEMEAAIRAGMDKAAELKEAGYQILASGEMGIGNTTTSSAIAAVLLDRPPEQVTGCGAGLSGTGLQKKIQVIQKAIELHRPDASDPADVLMKLGGFDIAAMTGLYLGAAAEGLPVIADGFISLVAALVAVRMAPGCREYILPSHVSEEPAVRSVLKALHMEPVLHAGMHLGEGTGAAALFPLLDMASAIYTGMSTFSDIRVEAYQDLN